MNVEITTEKIEAGFLIAGSIAVWMATLRLM